MEARRGIFFLFFFVLGTFAFSAHFSLAAGPTYIWNDINGSTAVTWTKEDSPYVISNILNINAPLTIEAGTIVKFGRNGGLAVRNDFHVNGTSAEKAVFTSFRDDSVGGDTDKDGGSVKPEIGSWSYLMINVPKGKEMKIRYAEMRYSTLGFYIISSAENMSLKYCDIRKNGFGIWAYNPDLTIEKNVITGNLNVGIKTEAGSRTATAVNNAIFNNKAGAEGISAGFPNPNSLKAANNWWGDESGPLNAQNPDGKGNSVSGLVSFDPWLTADPIASLDPVIVIPGIMGSWEADGKWKIDPIFHTYDNLRDEFLANGYEDGKNFFTFPYQWRDSNVDNAKLLREKIEQIKTDTGRPKVDIVAHSMGGLLAREYIESNYYAGDVDQLITVGTPQLGAPKDYVTWEAGEFLGFWSPVMKRLVALEALENGYLDVFDYIHKRPMKSVEELLPTYNYLYDEIGNDYILRAGYPANYPRNEFLENLNSADNIKSLKNIDFTKIIGKLENNNKTISGFNVVPKSGEIWKHGFPKWFGTLVLEELGRRTSDGDETVPLYSAEAFEIPADKTIYNKSSHNDLPTDAQKDILEILTEKRPTIEMRSSLLGDILIATVHSPVDIQIVSPSEKRLGKNFETGGIYNEIEGAYYTGFDTETEFLTIPNPEDGEYKIITEGTGTGEYKIEVAKITEDESDPQNVKESTATITGTAEDGVMQEAEIEVAENEVIYNPDTDPPVIGITSPEGKEYSNDTYALDFSSVISDAGSGIEDSSIEKLLNGELFNDEKLDLSLKNLGSHNYQVRAKDKAGNSGSAEVAFQNTTSLNAIQKNVVHYFNLGLIKKKIAKRYLGAKLKHLEKLFELLEKTKNSKLKSKPKQTAVDALEKKINADINRLIRRVSQRAPRWFDQIAVNRLMESLGYLKIN